MRTSSTRARTIVNVISCRRHYVHSFLYTSDKLETSMAVELKRKRKTLHLLQHFYFENKLLPRRQSCQVIRLFPSRMTLRSPSAIKPYQITSFAHYYKTAAKHKTSRSRRLHASLSLCTFHSPASVVKYRRSWPKTTETKHTYRPTCPLIHG